jgi:hypothetical protein
MQIIKKPVRSVGQRLTDATGRGGMEWIISRCWRAGGLEGWLAGCSALLFSTLLCSALLCSSRGGRLVNLAPATSCTVPHLIDYWYSMK